MDAQIQALAQNAGIVFDGFDPRMLPAGSRMSDYFGGTASGVMAMDAAYPLVTSANSGIPAILSTYVDPKLIEVLVAPMKAAEAIGSEVKKGDWTTPTAMFTMIESTGEVASYNDYSANGSTGTNFQFPQRQSYHFQTITQWGEQELARAGLAKVDLAARLNIASALTMNKYQNKTYLFGVSGLQNYGATNDPNLAANLTPATKAAGGTAWITSAGVTKATAIEVVNDIRTMFFTLQAKTNGLVKTDEKMTLIMSPQSEVALTITDQFNVNVRDILNKVFPNLEIRTVPEYATASGQLVQLVVEEFEGQRTWDAAFTEKMRAHQVVLGLSDYKQKKSAGTWGTIIYRPLFLVGLLGV